MRALTLPNKYSDEYARYIRTDPEIPAGKTYLESFMLSKGLLPKEKQTTLGVNDIYV